MAHWLDHLPEIGDALLARAARIEATQAEIERLQASLFEQEATVNRIARQHWTASEIRAAKAAVRQAQRAA